jgi:transposase-like protein
MTKTTNKFSPEVRDRAVRMVGEHRADYSSEWAAMTSIAGKIGCTAETLRRCYSRAFTLVVDSAPQPHALVVNFHHHLGEMPPTGRLERRFAA